MNQKNLLYSVFTVKFVDTHRQTAIEKQFALNVQDYTIPETVPKHQKSHPFVQIVKETSKLFTIFNAINLSCQKKKKKHL